MAVSPIRKYPLIPGDVVADVPENVNRAINAIDTDLGNLFADTGWKDVVLRSGFTAGFEGARYRRKAGVVYVQIMALRPGGWSSEAIVTTMPEGYRPEYSFWLVGLASGKPIECRVAPDGNIRTVVPATTEVLVFSGSFPID